MQEPVNVDYCETVMRRCATRRLVINGLPVYDVLESIVRRARNVRSGFGKIAVMYNVPDPVAGLEGRLNYGLPNDAEVPEELQHEAAAGVPRHLMGLSAFSFPKVVKYIIRHGTGLEDYDAKNCFYTRQAIRLEREQKPVPPMLRDYNERSEEILQELPEYLSAELGVEVTRDAAKKLLISFGFAGGTARWLREELGIERDHSFVGEWGQFLHDFEAEQRAIRDQDALAYSEAYRHFVEQKRPNPKASLAFALYANEERAMIKEMRAVLGTTICSLEHDGTPALGATNVVERMAAVGVRVALKEAPVDPLAAVALKYPKDDWSVVAKMPNERYSAAMRQICASFAHGPEARRNIDSVFGDVVGSRLQSTVVANRVADRKSYEHFNFDEGRWIVHPKEDLVQLIKGELSMLCTYKYESRNGRMRVKTNPVVSPLLKIAFSKGLVDYVMTAISDEALDLDGDHSRHKILFSNGMLWDFRSGRARPALPSDRMSRTTACPLVEWEHAQEALPVIQNIHDFFAAGGKSFYSGDALGDGIPTGESIRESLGGLDSKLLKMLLDFCGDWDHVVYLLRMGSRAASGWAKFCEFLYIHGAGSSGKDVVLSLLMRFFGKVLERNYGATLPGSFVTSGRKADRESATPFLASCEACRLYWLSETPEHDDFSVDLMKPLTEQQGGAMPARGLHRAPKPFRPMGLAVVTSNFPLKIKNVDDDGSERRINVWDTKYKFVEHPTQLTHKRADPKLKDLIDAGEFNIELSFFARYLYITLSDDICRRSEIVPKPAAIVENNKSLFQGNNADRIQAWLTKKTDPVVRRDGAAHTTIKHKLQELFSLSEKGLNAILIKIGITPGGVGNSQNVRVLLWKHPRWTKAEVPALKLLE